MPGSNMYVVLLFFAVGAAGTDPCVSAGCQAVGSVALIQQEVGRQTVTSTDSALLADEDVHGIDSDDKGSNLADGQSKQAPEEVEDRRVDTFDGLNGVIENDKLVVIELDGNQHEELTSKYEFRGSVSNHNVFRRPEWSKSMRCRGKACAECWDKDGCWRPAATNTGDRHVHGRLLSHSGGKGWTSFKNMVHVKCAADVLYLDYVPAVVENGSLQFYWDGLEISKANGFYITPVDSRSSTLTLSNYFSNNGMEHGFAALPVSVAGGHTFEMIFTPSSDNVGGEALMKSIMFFTDGDYAECQDNKMCLETLLVDDVEHQALRNSNQKQYSCLLEASPDASTACGKWRDCLNDQSEADLRLLFGAAGVDAATAATSSAAPTKAPEATAAKATKAEAEKAKAEKPKEAKLLSRSKRAALLASGINASTDPLHCLDPGTEDSTAWACDCLDGMLKECSRLEENPDPGYTYTTLDACIKGLFCQYPNVCQEWHDDNCVPSSSLQTRAGSAQGREGPVQAGGSMDESLQSKGCI